MSTAIPFVNRSDELGELREGIESDERCFYAVVGPSGSGKSALIDQFQNQCEEESLYTVRHDISEPKSETAFIYRLLEAWDRSLPDSKWDSVKERVKNANTEPFIQAAKFADPAVGIGARIVNAALSGTVDSDELSSATDEVGFIINLLKESTDKKVVVFIDQFDERRLSQPVTEELGRIFRELSNRSPSNIVWVIGSDHKFGKYEDDITHVPVRPLNTNAIEELIDKIGANIGDTAAGNKENEDAANFITEVTNFDGPNLTKQGLIDEIKTRTKGHPFMLALFLQTVHNEDISRTIQELPINEEKVRRHLEERLLDRMSPEEEELLRDVCVLEIFDANLAAHLSENTVGATRQILSDLKQRSIIREVESSSEKQTYRSHDLIRDFLQDEIMGARERQSRYKAIAVFAYRISENLTSRSSEPEIVDPYLDSCCEKIRLHFNKILLEEQVESVLTSIYSACDDLNYIMRSDIETGLKYCYSEEDTDSLPETIGAISKAD